MRAAYLALFLLLFSSVAEARFAGVEYAEVTVKGEKVSFPIGNPSRKHEVYYLKKALGGDKEAREIFLGGAPEKWFFIGEYEPLWLVVTEDSERIVKP